MQEIDDAISMSAVRRASNGPREMVTEAERRIHRAAREIVEHGRKRVGIAMDIGENGDPHKRAPWAFLGMSKLWSKR